MIRAYLNGPGDDYLKRLAKYPALLREAEQMRGFAKRVLLRCATFGRGLRSRGLSKQKLSRTGEPVLL